MPSLKALAVLFSDLQNSGYVKQHIVALPFHSLNVLDLKGKFGLEAPLVLAHSSEVIYGYLGLLSFTVLMHPMFSLILAGFPHKAG